MDGYTLHGLRLGWSRYSQGSNIKIPLEHQSGRQLEGKKVHYHYNTSKSKRDIRYGCLKWGGISFLRRKDV